MPISLGEKKALMQRRVNMYAAFLRILVIASLASVYPAVGRAQIPMLPDGAETAWIVEGAEEIITHVLFDPATVAERLPSGLSFLTMSDLAKAGNAQARAYLETFSDRSEWGVSFLEIVRQEDFRIDGRVPNQPPNGAIALWFAGVKPAPDSPSAEGGRLALDLWVPDSAYVAYMRSKGHYASYGDVRLSRTASGVWEGSILVTDLRVLGRCRPGPDVRPLPPGRQLVYPPAGSKTNHVIRTAYAGHQEKTCDDEAWDISGTHPLSNADRIEGSVFQFGYRLHGGAYRPFGQR